MYLPCFRPTVERVEGRQVVEPLVIHAIQHGVDHPLQLHEIHQQPDGVELAPRSVTCAR